MITFNPFLGNRRFDTRIPLETHVSTFVQDHQQRALTFDISESGLYLQALPRDPLPPRTPIGVEIELPGFGETIWVAGETCRDARDNYFYGFGVRFRDMAKLHQRMLHAYCRGARRRAAFRGRLYD
jgi:hypothetical protein